MECQASQKGLDTVITRIEELISIAVKRIAARHNATAVSILEYNFYINPDNDITAEVLADINQDFKENHMLYFK
jgi:Skp family chaperone for outer membrane proteins